MESRINYDYDDSKLIYQINEFNDDAKNLIYQKYMPMIHKEINRVKKSAYALKIDMSDLSQEALLAFSNAINSYDENNEAKFATFATLCVRRRLLNTIEKYASGKSHIMKTALLLDTEVDLNQHTILDYVKDSEGREPLNRVLNNELLEEINETIDKKLSANEQKVLRLSLSGKSNDEIAQIMNMNSKQIYNLIHRARNKIKSN